MYILSNTNYQWNLKDKNPKFKSLIINSNKKFGIDILTDNGDCGFTNDDLNVKFNNEPVKYGIKISSMDYSIKYENRHGYPFIKANDSKGTAKIILCSLALPKNSKFVKVENVKTDGIKVLSHKYAQDAVFLILKFDKKNIKGKTTPKFEFKVQEAVQVNVKTPGVDPYFDIHTTLYQISVEGDKVKLVESTCETYTAKEYDTTKVDPFKNYRPAIPYNTIIFNGSKNKVNLKKFRINQKKVNMIDLSLDNGNKILETAIKENGVTAATVVVNGTVTEIINRIKTQLSKNDHAVDNEIADVIDILKKFKRWNILTNMGSIINQFPLV